MAKLGFRKINDMIGRVDKLKINSSDHWKKSKNKFRFFANAS